MATVYKLNTADAFDRSVEVLKALGHPDLATYREGFLRHAGLAYAESRKARAVTKGGKETASFSAAKVAASTGVPLWQVPLLAGAWAMAVGENSSKAVLANDRE